jgi:integrase
MLFWEEREAGSFLKWADKHYSDFDNGNRSKARKHFVIYLMALNTGMRAGELWGLRPQDFFFGADGAGDTIFVRRQFTLLTREIAPLKGELKSDRDKSRHVPCPPDLRKELEAFVAFNKTASYEPVFQSVNGTPIHHDSFCDRFHRDV